MYGTHSLKNFSNKVNSEIDNNWYMILAFASLPFYALALILKWINFYGSSPLGNWTNESPLW